MTDFPGSTETAIKAQALRPGDSVAIVSPAGPPNQQALETGVRFLSESGFKVCPGRHLLKRCGYLAGNDAERASDFNDALGNPDIRAVFCSRGGFGSARIVRDIDYEALRRDPKIIVGFSDVTTILAAVWTHCRLITFHGPLVGSSLYSAWTWKHLLQQLTGATGSRHQWPITVQPPPIVKRISLGRQGSITGRTYGGCLSILCTLTGTPWAPASDPAILFFEDIGEAPYRVDRMLTHLANAGWFQHAGAVITGDFANCTQREDDPEPTPDVETVLHQFLEKRHIPAVLGLPFGHNRDSLTIPFGIQIHIDSKGIVQIESPVCRT